MICRTMRYAGAGRRLEKYREGEFVTNEVDGGSWCTYISIWTV